MRKIWYYLNVSAVVLVIGLQALVSHKTMSFVLGRKKNNIVSIIKTLKNISHNPAYLKENIVNEPILIALEKPWRNSCSKISKSYS